MSSSSNAWIYTEDLRKYFLDRYANKCNLLVPIYLQEKSQVTNYNTTMESSKVSNNKSALIYGKSIHDYLFNSQKQSTCHSMKPRSSSAYCVINRGFTRDEIPIDKNLRRNSEKKYFPVVKHKLNVLSKAENMNIDAEDDVNLDNMHLVPLIKKSIPYSIYSVQKQEKCSYFHQQN